MTSAASASLLQNRFRQRAEISELMDDLAADEKLVRQSLRELAFLNTWLGGYDVLFHAFQQIKPRLRAATEDRTPLRVLDLACGGGDVLLQLSQWAQRQNLPMVGMGVDMNPVMIAVSRETARSAPNLTFAEHSVWDPTLANYAADVVICSQFCHHLSDTEWVRFLGWTHQLARKAVIISDLHRSPLAYHSIRLLTGLFSRSAQVRFDAPVSVLRGMTRREWKDALAAAGISEYRLRWVWAFRWQVIFPA